jgi:hypothetical protein
VDTGKIYDFELLRAERRALSLALDLGIQLDPRTHPLDFAIALWNEYSRQLSSNKKSPNIEEIRTKIEAYSDIFKSLRSRHLID